MRDSRLAAWLVHLYTASGLVFAMLAAFEIFAPDCDPRWVLVWLTVAVLIDATDGTLARRYAVKRVLPQIDGRKIDDILDYLTFTFLPLTLIVRMGWLPAPAMLWVIPAAIASILGFAKVTAKVESSGFFCGFPSYWNIVALYAGIVFAHLGPMFNAIMLLLLAVLTIAPVGFIYPNLAPPRWRRSILIGGVVWLLIVAAMFPTYPEVPWRLVLASLVYPAFYVWVSLYEYFHNACEVCD